MTASAPIPADMAGRMPNSPTASEAPGTQAPTQAGAATDRPTLRSQIAENPLMSFFCLLIVALLAAAIASPHIRIDDTNRRIDRLEARMVAEFEKIDARFEKIDARFEKIDERFEKIDERFEKIDEKMDERFEKMDERFDAVEARLDELGLNLTALIAALRATDDVKAAVEGRLGTPSS